jgi:hypothetical protein
MQGLLNYFGSLALWQMTSTAKLKANPKAIASHNEALVINAFIIMIRQKMATITVKAFFSVKYFFITVDLHEIKRLANIKCTSLFISGASVDGRISSTKILL